MKQTPGAIAMATIVVAGSKGFRIVSPECNLTMLAVSHRIRPLNLATYRDPSRNLRHIQHHDGAQPQIINQGDTGTYRMRADDFARRGDGVRRQKLRLVSVVLIHNDDF